MQVIPFFASISSKTSAVVVLDTPGALLRATARAPGGIRSSAVQSGASSFVRQYLPSQPSECRSSGWHYHNAERRADGRWAELWAARSLATGIVVGGWLYGLQIGGLAISHHYTLRVLLARRRTFPLEARRFLDDAVARALLKRQGGGTASSTAGSSISSQILRHQ